jgi:hypothetical protein
MPGNRIQEAGGRRQEAESRRQEAGGRKQKAGGRRELAAGDVLLFYTDWISAAMNSIDEDGDRSGMQAQFFSSSVR